MHFEAELESTIMLALRVRIALTINMTKPTFSPKCKEGGK